MKKFYILIAVILTSFNLQSKDITVHQGDQVFAISSDSWTELSFNLSIPSFEIQTAKTTAGLFSEIILEGTNTSLQVGAPKLPVLKRLIEVPFGAEFNVELISTSYTDVDLSSEGYEDLLLPYQGEQIKTWTGTRPFHFDQQAYSNQGFLQNDLVSVEYVGEMRGVNIARLNVSPFWYNPATHILRVWHEVQARITYSGGDVEGSKEKKAKYHSPVFGQTFKHIWNFKPVEQSNGTENVLSNGPVHMVIVSDSLFRGTLQPFIDWKRRKGFEVTEAWLQDPQVGSSNSNIKNYLQGLYNNPAAGSAAPSFVVFVGDIAQLQPFTKSGHVTDRDFCEYTNDALPEVYYGRFSAENVSQLQAQISKTLEYEQYMMQDPAFLNSMVLIAGADGTFGPTHGNGQINYGTFNYFNTAHGLSTDAFLYPNSSSNAALIRQKIGAGVSIANYTAHGSSSGWADPSFNTSHVSAMNNPGRYPLMIGNACLTNKFNANNPCFGEALLRASDKGAIGYIGASNNTYWDEDFYWAVGVGTISANPTYAGTTSGLYDLMFHEHGESFSEWAITSAQIMFAGNLAVTQGGSSVNYYWEIYHLMGDPSLMPYLGMPQALQASYVPLLPLGLNTFTVNTEPYAYVAVTYNGTLHGATLADSNGVAALSLTPFTMPCLAEIVITAQNREPFIGSLTVASPNGPYLIYAEHTIDDMAGNSNGQADYGEPVSLDMEISNLTTFAASSVDCKLRTTDPYVSLIDTSHTASAIPGNDTLSVAGMFSFKVDSLIPDGHNVDFTLFLDEQGGDSWSSQFQVLLNAPRLEIIGIEIDDKVYGNANGRLDAGETADLVVKALNSGHADAAKTCVTLMSSAWEVPVIGGGILNFNICNAGDTLTAVYPTSVASQTPNGLVVQFDATVLSNMYGDQEQLKLMVGIVDEDFETGDFKKYSWQASGSLPWTIDSVNVQEGTYSSRSGAIGHQAETVMSVSMNVISDDSITFYRMVSSEQHYDFLEFHIDGNVMDQWSGNSGWVREAYHVTAGQHTFSWEYNKDYYLSSGQDCGWIDYIVFPPSDVFAGTGDDPEQVSGLKLWPNPATNEVNLEFNVSRSETIIQVFDASGRKVRDLMVPAGFAGQSTVQYNITGLEGGLYYIVVENEGMKESLPLLIISQ